MNTVKRSSTQPSLLRQRAEAFLRKTPADIDALTADDVKTLVHELQIYQVELEMQNEELRRAQSELIAARDRYSDLYDFSPVGYLGLDGRGVILQANLAAANLLGTERQRLLGTPLSRFLVTTAANAFYLYLKQLLASQTRQECQLELSRADGTTWHAELAGIAMAEQETEPEECRIALSDVTARIKAEQILRGARDALERRVEERTRELETANQSLQDEIGQRDKVEKDLGESEARFRMLADNVPALFSYLGADQHFRYVNKAYETLFGMSRQDIVGQHLKDVIGAEAYEVVRDRIQEALAGQRVTYEATVPLAQSGTRCMTVIHVPHFDNQGQVAGIFNLAQDVTEQKQIQEQLLQSERLAAIGEAMTGLTHESRNALQRSYDCLQLLALEIKQQPEQMELVGRIQAAQDHLLRLFEQVRSYAAPIKPKRQPCQLGELLDETWGHLVAERKGRDARLIQSDDTMDLGCDVEPAAIEQVFRNVLENSLAACPDPVTIEVAWSEATIDGCPAVVVTLANNGPALSDEEGRNFFKPFFTTKTHGTGLGMAISKRIVDAHGGQITAVKHDGRGVVIRIGLPRNTTSQQ